MTTGSESDMRGKRKNEAGEPITPELEQIIQASTLPNKIKKSARDGLFLGQMFLKEYIESIQNSAVLTGFKPTSKSLDAGMHIGHKFIVDILVAMQRAGSQVYIALADEEARLTGGHELEKSKLICAQYLIDMGALGLNLDDTYIYLQSEEPVIKNIARKLEEVLFGGADNPEVIKHYNGADRSYREAGFNQAGDILLPQVLTGPKHVLVPCGPDQETHLDFAIKFARKLDDRFREPVPLYVGHIGSLRYAGKKMSSSMDGDYAIFLVDSPQHAKDIVRSLKPVQQDVTGVVQNEGHVINTLAPEICPLVDLFKYHFAEDATSLLAPPTLGPVGGYKQLREYVADHVSLFLAEHQRRREQVFDYVIKKVNGESVERPTFWYQGGIAPKPIGQRTAYEQIILSIAQHKGAQTLINNKKSVTT